VTGLLRRLRNALSRGDAHGGGDADHGESSDIEAAIRLHEQGEISGAEEIYRRVLEHDPRHPQALHLLGLAAHQRGQHATAVDLIGRAIAIDPSNGLQYLNLGNAQRALGQSDAAVASYARAVGLDPERFAAWFNLGQLLSELGRADEAIPAFRRALAIDPTGARAHVGLAAALVSDAKHRADPAPAFTEAVALIESRWQSAPDRDQARVVLAAALEASGRWTEAATHLEALVAAHPAYPELHSRLANCYNRLGRAIDAAREYRETFRLAPEFHHALSSVLGVLNAVPDVAPEDVLEAHRDWAKFIAAPLYPAAPSFDNERSPDRRLRIGYISPDLRRHPVGVLFAPVLDHHDRVAFETFCYYNYRGADAMTERMRRAASHWRDVADLDDAALAEQVRADRIDILVDLAGHTMHTRLPTFARRPAPVQVSWLGYFNTTGVATMDYFVTDPHSSPPGQERYYVEELVRLPATRFCYEALDSMPAVNALPAERAGRVTFGCFNSLAKINPRVLALWARILRAVPTARLVLQAGALSDAPNRERFRAIAVAQGIPSERLELRAFVPVDEAAAAYHGIDIALDPFPFCGGMTSLDALWMGVPVVTLPQTMIAGRQTAALLANLGLDELVASDEKRYVETAVSLANDLPRLAALRAGLRERFRASPLADTERFTRDLEHAYREIWRRWVRDKTEDPPRA
jgi:protein O-GlcNAc transferase